MRVFSPKLNPRLSGELTFAAVMMAATLLNNCAFVGGSGSPTTWSDTNSAQLSLNPPGNPIPPKLFGMHIHHMITGAAQPTPWPSVPFSAWRLWDAYAAWPWVEPEKGKWNFIYVDKYVSMAEEQHVEILMPLALSPAWASARPEEKSSYGPGNAAPPNNLDDWRDYVRTMATRYKGRVHLYEIWNEPDVRTMFSGDVTTFVGLLREAYRILKEVDPHNLVVSPSMNASDPTSIKLFEQFLAHGGGNFVNAISYHFYPPQPKVPEQIPTLVQQVREVMSAHGISSKQVWNTETGWDIANHQPLKETNPRAQWVLDDAESSAYVARAYILTWASRVDRLYWYSWDGEFVGLVEPDGKTLKPAAKAYEVVEGWLVGAVMLSCVRNRDGTWVAELSRPSNYDGWIVWNPNQTQKFELPRDWNAGRMRDLHGSQEDISLKAQSEIGPSPVLFESAGN